MVEYFVNQTEYQHIMNLIAELGGLDLDSLLTRMTNAENAIADLTQEQTVMTGQIGDIEDDITSINNDISVITAAETDRNTWRDVLAWGNYYTANQTLQLSYDISQFDFLVAVAGYTAENTNSGYGSIYIPKVFFNANNAFTIPFYVGTSIYKVSAIFTDNTHIKILNSTNTTMGLRTIRGKKA